MSDQPVSVVMPVRNAQPFLDEAVASILDQTHGNFELVIGDDGSTDGSGERLAEWAKRDSRIRLLRNPGPGLGPSGSSNWVVREARHPLIARMDADDISLPDRLALQLRALGEYPDAVLVGSLYECIDADSRVILGRNRATLINSRRVAPPTHGTILFRRDAFDRAGGYRPKCDYWEDIDLFIRMGRQGRLLILPEALYRYRYSPTSSRLMSNEALIARATDLCLRCMDAHRRGEDYEALIERHQSGLPDKVAPAVMLSAALPRLWLGEARSLIGWEMRHAMIGWNRQSAVALVLALWAWTNPASLRAFFRVRTRFADWRARRAIPDGRVYSWQTRRARATSARPQHLGPSFVPGPAVASDC